MLVGLAVGSVARAENPQWDDLRRQFRDQFKTEVGLAERHRAVNLLARSADARAIPMLLNGLDAQLRWAAQARAAWRARARS